MPAVVKRSEGFSPRSADQARVARSSISVRTPQVPSRTVITRVPGLRPARTSETSSPAAASRARVASISATLQLKPQQLIGAALGKRSRPANQFHNKIAAAEEHQVAPVLVRAIERHVESQSRPDKAPRRVRHQWSKPPRDPTPARARPISRASAAALRRVRERISGRRSKARLPPLCASIASLRLTPSRGFRFPQSAPASAPRDRACARPSRCRTTRKQMLASPSPALFIASRMRSEPCPLPEGAISSSDMFSSVKSAVSTPSPRLRHEGARPSSNS